jgi:MFS family permease
MRVSVAMLIMGFGEELWKRFLPKYLEALGAPVVAIGAFGTTRDLLDGLYQLPGGWLADRYGRRIALLVCVGVASIGYLVYLSAGSWPVVFAGLAFAMGWTSAGSPTLFAVVADVLPRNLRTMGFTVQAIVRRIPIVIAPTIGGLIIRSFGTVRGIRTSLGVTCLLAAVATMAIAGLRLPVQPHVPLGIAGIWRTLPTALRRLLASDVLVRIAEGMVDVLIVLYATNLIGVSTARFGALVAIQVTTSMLVYVPAARVADRLGRKPFVIATFVCFACYPVAIALSHSFAALVVAFVIGGLREIGEPARKALIVDLAEPHVRGRAVGLYYLIRGLSITPAGVIGALLWTIAPATPFYVAGAIGMAGALVFAFTVRA